MDDEKAERPWPVVRLVRRAGAPAEEQAGRPVDRPEEIAAAPRAGGWNVRITPRPGDRDPRPVDAALSEDAHAEPPPLQAAVPPPAAGGAEDDQWLQTWQRQEIKWLSSRVEELEQQLRRRTVILGGALGLCGLISVLAVGYAALAPRGPEWPIAAFDLPLVPDGPAGSPPAAGETPERAAAAPSAALIPSEPAAPELALEPASRSDDAVTVGQGSEPPGPELAPLAAPPAAAAGVGPAEDQALQQMLATVEAAERVRETGVTPGDADVAAAGDTPDDARYVVTAVVYLRAEPAPDAEVVNVLAPGEEVRRIGADGDWLRVEFIDLYANPFTGYVPGLYLRPAAPEPQSE